METLFRRFWLPVLLFVLCSTAHAQALFFQPPAYGEIGQTMTADFNHDGKTGGGGAQAGTYALYGNWKFHFRARRHSRTAPR